MRARFGSAFLFLAALGQSVSGWQSPVIGYAIMGCCAAAGFAYLASHERVRRRIPYRVVRKHPAIEHATAGGTGQPALDRSLREIANYLVQVEALMGQSGFSRAGGSPAATPSEAASLEDRLREFALRGHRLAKAAPISIDGASGPIEVWEAEIGRGLEDAGRHDLIARLEQVEPGDIARRIWSHRSATKGRLARKVRVLDAINAEFADAGMAPQRVP
jgi:hypothetical protein